MDSIPQVVSIVARDNVVEVELQQASAEHPPHTRARPTAPSGGPLASQHASAGPHTCSHGTRRGCPSTCIAPHASNPHAPDAPLACFPTHKSRRATTCTRRPRRAPCHGSCSSPCNGRCVAQADGDWGLTVRDSGVSVGVTVASVYSGGAAAAAGLERGDLIVGIGTEIVRSAERVRYTWHEDVSCVTYVADVTSVADVTGATCVT